MNVWTIEQIEMLRKHYDDGLSASHSALQLSRHFMISLSRNSVIGKRSRMGLVRNISKEHFRTSAQRAEELASKNVVENARKRLKRAEKMAALKASKARDAEVKRLREAVKHAQETEKERAIDVLSIYTRDAVVGLKRNQCRFPINIVGAPDFHFCHEVKDEGSSYCAHHRAICCIKVPLKMKAA